MDIRIRSLSKEDAAGGGSRRRWHLSRAVASMVAAASAALVIVCCILYAAVFYLTLDQRAVDDLAAETEGYAQVINDSGYTGTDAIALVKTESTIEPDTRMTLISSDGTVLYDSLADESSMENHAQRPEVVEAMQTGEGQSGRYSETLGEETLYHSVLLADGSVLRLSVTQSSIWGVMGTIALPCLLVLLLAVVVSFLIGYAIARRVISRMEKIDLNNPIEGDAPEELMPLLRRLDAQHRRLDAQASERRMFTANVSHELKTPLTVISGYAEIIDKGIAKPRDVRRFAGLIHDEAQQMKSMVEEIIALTHLDEMGEGQMELDMQQEVPLESVANNAVARLRPLAERSRVDLVVQVSRVDNEPIKVRGNARILEEMVRNLAENAVRYNHEGGRAVVEVASEGGHAVVRVSDTGRGIPHELRERVFERFFRVEGSRSKDTGGSGLGLAIVKHAAQVHGASISITDNDPIGTIITVTFSAK